MAIRGHGLRVITEQTAARMLEGPWCSSTYSAWGGTLVLTENGALWESVVRKATSFSTSVGPALSTVVGDFLLQALPLVDEEAAPVAYCCENDHAAVAELRAKLHGRVEVVACMVRVSFMPPSTPGAHCTSLAWVQEGALGRNPHFLTRTGTGNSTLRSYEEVATFSALNPHPNPGRMLTDACSSAHTTTQVDRICSSRSVLKSSINVVTEPWEGSIIPLTPRSDLKSHAHMPRAMPFAGSAVFLPRTQVRQWSLPHGYWWHLTAVVPSWACGHHTPSEPRHHPLRGKCASLSSLISVCPVPLPHYCTGDCGLSRAAQASAGQLHAHHAGPDDAGGPPGGQPQRDRRGVARRGAS